MENQIELIQHTAMWKSYFTIIEVKLRPEVILKSSRIFQPENIDISEKV